jgi:hypothetical protein
MIKTFKASRLQGVCLCKVNVLIILIGPQGYRNPSPPQTMPHVPASAKGHRLPIALDRNLRPAGEIVVSLMNSNAGNR